MNQESSNRIRTLLHRARGRAVLMVGAGVTGVAVARLLSQADFPVVVIDENETAEAVRAELGQLGCELHDVFTPKRDFFEKKNFAFSVLSPGIALEGELSRLISTAGIPKVSELDLGVAFLGMPQIAVTGTNGKTTTVHLIQQMLLASGSQAELVGNVGRPFVSLIDPRKLFDDQPTENMRLVAEVSSYQLEAAVDFTPHIAVWLNIDDDHLERHQTLAQYLRIKARIFSGQSQERDWSLINIDDKSSGRMKEFAKGRYFPFGCGDERSFVDGCGCFYHDSRNEVIFGWNNQIERYPLQHWKLLGLHNKLNLVAAIAAARLGGASPDGVRKTIVDFVALSHRLEVVKIFDGITYINDSKATNVSATCQALETVWREFRRRDVILLLGGQRKAGTWAPIRQLFLPGLKAVLVFGGSREGIFSDLTMGEVQFVGESVANYRLTGGKELLLEKIDSMEDAIRRAKQLAVPGDVVLLAPACSSFDAFSNYAERGERFRAVVEDFVA